LRRSGLVQIDFTENGSLAALRRKIDDNDYHILRAKILKAVRTSLLLIL